MARQRRVLRHEPAEVDDPAQPGRGRGGGERARAARAPARRTRRRPRPPSSGSGSRRRRPRRAPPPARAGHDVPGDQLVDRDAARYPRRRAREAADLVAVARAAGRRARRRRIRDAGDEDPHRDTDGRRRNVPRTSGVRRPAAPGRIGLVSRLFAGRPREACDLRDSRRCAPPPGALCSGPSCDAVVKGNATVVGRRRATEGQLRGLLLQRNLLCALTATRRARPSGRTIRTGLRPPQQLRFVFRQERRRQAAWAFPTAQEQAALHA